ncbi:TlpA family protein disulfide reductase [Chitinophaga filiformis]|nr:redoxin domain-containing protein [Chitinophaga filiformis]
MKLFAFASWLMVITLFACKRNSMAVLPDFSFRLADSSTVLKTSDIPSGKTIVVILFEADCSGCQQTTDSLLQNINKLKDVQFYFLSTEQLSQVTLFRDYYKLSKYSNITVGQDHKNFLPTYFKSHGTPQIALYNAEKQLQGIINGKPNINLLIEKITSIH